MGTLEVSNYDDGNRLPERHNTGMSRDQVELIKRTIAKGSSDDELKLFVQVCDKTGLDPFARQIYAVKRWDGRERREVMSIQVSIDGFRLIADRACATRGLLRGEKPTQWADENGVWHDEWLKAAAPVAARYTTVITHPSGAQAEFTAVARFAAYSQKTKEGKPMGLWGQMPDVMIAKCAEALCLRKAFPAELSGLYTADEMAQANNHQATNDYGAAARGARAELAAEVEVPGVKSRETIIEAEVVEAEVVAPVPAPVPADHIGALEAKKRLVAAANGDKDIAKNAWCAVRDINDTAPILLMELDIMLSEVSERVTAKELTSAPVATDSGITPAQVKKIHAIKGERSLSDEAYRALLSELAGVSSSKDLTKKQAESLIEKMSATEQVADYEEMWHGEVK